MSVCQGKKWAEKFAKKECEIQKPEEGSSKIWVQMFDSSSAAAHLGQNHRLLLLCTPSDVSSSSFQVPELLCRCL